MQFKAAFVTAAIASLAAASPTPRDTCSTGPIQCCNTVMSENNPVIGLLSGLLGIVLPNLGLNVGLQCSPISLLGLGGGAWPYAARTIPAASSPSAVSPFSSKHVQIIEGMPFRKSKNAQLKLGQSYKPFELKDLLITTSLALLLVSMSNETSTRFLQFSIQWASMGTYILVTLHPVAMLTLVNFTSLALITPSPSPWKYALFANVLYLLDIAGQLRGDCDTWYQFIGALSVLGRAAIIFIFVGRTCAIWAKNRLLLAYMSVLGVACMALDITHVPGLRCTGDFSVPMLTDLLPFYDRVVNGVLAILMLFLEFSSAVLNCIKYVQACRTHGQSWNKQKDGLQHLLFTQELFYFSVVPLLSLASVIVGFIARVRGDKSSFSEAELLVIDAFFFFQSGFLQHLFTALTLPLSGLFAARLLLHIREWEYKHSPAGANTTVQEDQAPQQLSAVSTMVFIDAATNTLSEMIYADFGSGQISRDRVSGR
ncbi:hypothetical protein D9757_014001 [Collybiopsis confluens]|uniref:Uncharacterized protein n=1 Tax=Collybiopsis confluens TaxID=2823264 RepID=A0A8H5M8C0_9AGAR|nr:hypothetical protein D9757_014001 [Collybiopsis confluens]